MFKKQNPRHRITENAAEDYRNEELQAVETTQLAERATASAGDHETLQIHRSEWRVQLRGVVLVLSPDSLLRLSANEDSALLFCDLK